MDSKTELVKTFLDKFENALERTKCDTIEERFIIDMLLAQHQKRRYIFDLLNWHSLEEYINGLYNEYFTQYGLINAINFDDDVDITSYQSIDNYYWKNKQYRTHQYSFHVIMHNNELFLMNHLAQSISKIDKTNQNLDNYNQVIEIINSLEDNFCLASKEQFQRISSLTKCPPYIFPLNLWQERNQLARLLRQYEFLMSDLLNDMCGFGLGTVISASILTIIYFTFNVLSLYILATTILSLLAIVIFGFGYITCLMFFTHINNIILNINEPTCFSTTYDKTDLEPKILEQSEIHSCLSTDGKKITLSSHNSPQIFFKNQMESENHVFLTSIIQSLNDSIDLK